MKQSIGSTKYDETRFLKIFGGGKAFATNLNDCPSSLFESHFSLCRPYNSALTMHDLTVH